MTLPRKITLLGALITTVGVLAMTPFVYLSIQQRYALATASPGHALATAPVPEPAAISGHPVHLSIPSLDIELEVIDGHYDANTGQWTLTTDKAQYALPSVLPNDKSGDTMIYGHYRPEVFAYLHHIVPGARAYIRTSNHYQFEYTFTSSESFSPTNTSVFAYKGRPRLTVQTCSGVWMQNRQMYYFRFDGVHKLVG